VSREVRVVAPAKVNLYLGVGEVLASGYHAVTSVLHTLELADTLTIVPAAKLSLCCATDVGVPPEENLVWRAAVAMGEALGREPHFEIEIAKQIPHGAGLGGGSSDAAAAIAGLAHLWGEDPLDERCLQIARSLGADVPFFLYGGAALMGGRGDELVRRLPALDVPVLLVRPHRPVSTAAAYRAFDAAPVPAAGESGTVAALVAREAGALARALANNMEAASVAVVPEVGEALAWVRGQEGVLGAEVAGSGSAVFALTESIERTRALADEAATRGWWSVATRLRQQGVDVTKKGSG
jgi:4-diphosphocytidyl-2-C-methyl-D-erythritol kinase